MEKQKPKMWYPGIYYDHPLARGLVVALPMSNSGGSAITDYSPYHHAATFDYDTAWAMGQYGSHLHFDGSGDHVVIPNHPSFATFDDHTIVCLARPGASDRYACWVSCYDATTTDGWRLGQQSWGAGVMSYQCYVDGSSVVCSTGAPTADEWVMTAGRRSGARCTLSVNGVEQADVETLGGTIETTGGLYVGILHTMGAAFLGDIALVLIYSRALSDEELLALYVDPWGMFRLPRRVFHSLPNVRGFHVHHNSGVGPIDYDTVRAIKPHDTTSFESEVLTYPGDWRFGVRAFNKHGSEKNIDVVDMLELLEDGDEAPLRPNQPTDLRLVTKADGKVEVNFSYNSTGEETACTHFHVYYDAGSGEVDYSSPLGSVNKSDDGPSTHYSFLSGALVDNQAYRFAVRAATADDVEDDGIEYAEITADTEAPDQPESLSVTTVR